MHSCFFIIIFFSSFVPVEFIDLFTKIDVGDGQWPPPLSDENHPVMVTKCKLMTVGTEKFPHSLFSRLVIIRVASCGELVPKNKTLTI